jgi:putative transposase
MMHDIIQSERQDFPITRTHAFACSAPKPADNKLLNNIKGIVVENPRYGYRRVTHELRRKECIVNHKRVLAIMRQNGLQPKKKRKCVHTTNSNHNNPIYPNLAKDKVVDGLNQVWPADITYIHLANDETAYLATIIDRHSRRCLGWQLSRNIDAQLCIDALTMALHTRAGMSIEGVIHHSDRGVQYTSIEYTTMLKEHGIAISMSRKATPTDNAHAESFFKTIKYEEVYMNEYDSFTDAYSDIGHFIEEVYNQKRLHSAIGYQPPAEFEEKILKNECA